MIKIKWIICVFIHLELRVSLVMNQKEILFFLCVFLSNLDVFWTFIVLISNLNILSSNFYIKFNVFSTFTINLEEKRQIFYFPWISTLLMIPELSHVVYFDTKKKCPNIRFLFQMISIMFIYNRACIRTKKESCGHLTKDILSTMKTKYFLLWWLNQEVWQNDYSEKYIHIQKKIQWETGQSMS